MWWYYVIGYVFSIFLGYILIKLVIDEAWKGLGTFRQTSLMFTWHPIAIGCIERTLYFVSWIFGRPEFIAVWLALKVAGQWKQWSEGSDTDTHKIPGRTIYNVFLIGTGLSILYGITGAVIVEWLERGEYFPVLAVPSSLIIGTLSLWFLAKKSS